MPLASDGMRRIPYILLLVFAVLLSGCGGGQGDSLALRGVTVIDGLGKAPQPDRLVLIQGERIVDVGPAEGYDIPRGTRVVDLPGRFVVPGLIDLHAHVTILPMEEDGSLGAVHLADSERTLRTLLAFGITTVRNPAAPAADAVALRDRVATGEIFGPRILTAGDALNRTAAFFGPFVATPDEASVRQEVQRQAALGVDFLKVYGALPPELIGTAIEEAHALDLRVIGHLQRTTWTEGAQLGIDAITHGAPWSAAYLFPADREGYRGTIRDRITWLNKVDFDGPEIQEMITLLAERQIPIDPTLIAYHTKFFGNDPLHLENPELSLAPESSLAAWNRGTFVSDWTPEDFEQAQAAWPRMLELTRRLHEGGALLAAGSDLPNPWVIPGVSLHHELRLLHDAGIPPLEVLQIATYNGAVALGLEGEIGSIEPGKLADLLVLAADPTASLHNTRAIQHIFQRGEFLDPAALLASGQ